MFCLIRRCRERRKSNERASLDENLLPLYTTDTVKLSHNFLGLVSRLPCPEIVKETGTDSEAVHGRENMINLQGARRKVPKKINLSS